MKRKLKPQRTERPLDLILHDHTAREQFHSVYVALFNAAKASPENFRLNNLTRILTGLMGDRLWSWRVVGITPEALELFSQHDYKKPPLRGAVVRGHLTSRTKTAELLFLREQPLSADEFLSVFLEADQTVLMLPKQNPSRGDHIPRFIDIDNPHAYYFPCGSLMGYLHEEQEVEFLRSLARKRI